MAEYNSIDLNVVLSRLQGHIGRDEIDDVRAKCKCGAWVHQYHDKCPTCGIPVIWFNSYAWKKCFGDPRAMLREIDGVPASTSTGQTLIEKCEVIGFPNMSAEQDWAKAENRFGVRDMEGIIAYVVIKKGEKGQNAMAHAIAIARKKLRENPRKRQSKQEKTSNGPDMW